MKKEIKKLSLNKKTISNLSATEMSRQMGGYTGWWCSQGRGCGGATRDKGNTCPGHNTCNVENTCYGC